MRLLLLGGTAWLGRELARTARDRGDSVTCLARGASGPPVEGVELVAADRTEPAPYAAVRDQEWDAVVDVSRQPGQVRSAVTALRGSAGHFVFVSTGNVYADHRLAGQDESSPLLPPLAGDVMGSMEDYGPAKVACEQHVLDGFGRDRSLVARVGLIGGPGDEFDRTGYWPLRFSRPASSDGAVLVPDAPDLPTSVIDVRDLAGWLLDAARDRTAGVLNAMGPAVPLAEHLSVARTVAGHTGPVVPADPAWLLEHGVQPWMGEKSLPLWLDDPEWFGFNGRDSRAAYAAGLTPRPLAETLADTLAWERARPSDRVRGAGLTDADEGALLDLWRSRSTSSYPGS